MTRLKRRAQLIVTANVKKHVHSLGKQINGEAPARSFKEEGQEMYCETDFKTKREFKEAVAKGETVRLFAPGLGQPVLNGREIVEGPHFPKPHTWYASVEMRDGRVVRVH